VAGSVATGNLAEGVGTAQETNKATRQNDQKCEFLIGFRIGSRRIYWYRYHTYSKRVYKLSFSLSRNGVVDLSSGAKKPPTRPPFSPLFTRKLVPYRHGFIAPTGWKLAGKFSEPCARLIVTALSSGARLTCSYPLTSSKSIDGNRLFTIFSVSSPIWDKNKWSRPGTAGTPPDL
jgi:hypothetical protein